jgi:nucleotide-binding universal stress UspA family protein
MPPWEGPSPLVPRYERSRLSRSAYQRSVAEAKERLVALIPPEAGATGIVSEVDVIANRDPARAISAAVRRFGPDIVCLGSRGHGALTKALLGSVAQKVVARVRQPVLLVRPARP